MVTVRLNCCLRLDEISTPLVNTCDFIQADSPQGEQLMVRRVLLALCPVTCGKQTRSQP